MITSNNFQILKEELFSFITDPITKKINSSTLTESNFRNKNKLPLWEWVMGLDYGDLNFNQRVKWLQFGAENYFPTCYCGKPATMINRMPSHYCSKKCKFSSLEFSDSCKVRFQKRDEVTAKEKRKKTMMERFGVEFNSQREEIKHLWHRGPLPEIKFNKLNDPVWMKEEYITKNRTAVDIAQEIGVFYGTVIDYCQKHGFDIKSRSNYSREELKVGEFLDDLGIYYIKNTKSIISPLELDLWIPEKKLAIEINGLYWHSFPGNKERHSEKLEKCRELGISLLQFTDLEINTRWPVVAGIIKSKLGLNRKINGRDCEVKFIDNKIAKEFIDRNHLHKNANQKISVGLFYKVRLLMVLTFSKPRFTNHNWEIIRLCSEPGITVRGGFSKMLTLFRKNYPGNIMSYIDRNIGDGRSFSELGFNNLGITAQGYNWTDGDIIISRYKAQKKQLEKWLSNFDRNKTEVQMMQEAGFRQIWNCGNLIFELP